VSVDLSARLFSPGAPGNPQNNAFSPRSIDTRFGTRRMMDARRGVAKSATSMVMAHNPAQAAGL
jgi:hypothetical protein